ncbi:hypothetical protein CANMA_003969 [Candida margitis]|uniref:uncharacterized protein n=1 Tax=Candida margitis TaxID=1775924 RepID=UPI002227D830|nr:uncharacterized protein CANMA_003969 [Candida margitis]KAI5960707.1 hypothetical protein CANMA_003969 [Candida margitis]
MLFTLETKQVKAHPTRATGSTLVAKDAEDLTIVYNKYKSNRPRSKSQLCFNLVFCHGTGFNKSVWNYLIKVLYQISQSGDAPWHLDTVIAMDAIGHGDSSLANEGKLGGVYMWDDGAKDVNDIIKHEIATTGDMENNFETRTVIIGHSMGGFIALYAAFLEPALFDAVVAIEPVIYRTNETEARFNKSFKKLIGLMMDAFDTEQDARDYFEKYSFTKRFQPDVLQDYIADEIYKTKNEEGNNVYKTKCSKVSQVRTYLSSFLSIPKGMLALPSIRVPVFHVVGGDANWNARESVEWIRSAIRPDMLAGATNIEKGQHLVNSEQPDEVIKIINDALVKRDQDFKSTLSTIPEIGLKGDRKTLRDQQYNSLLNLDLDNVYGFDTKKHSPFDTSVKKANSKL